MGGKGTIRGYAIVSKLRMKRKEADIPVFIPADICFEIKQQFSRLNGELIELIRNGVKPKRTKFTEKMVIRFWAKVGMEKLKDVTYQEFENLYNEFFKK